MVPVQERPIAWVVLAAAVAAGAGVMAMPPACFQGDEGVKLIQAQALIASHWRSRALPYPGAEIDPEMRHFPLQPPFVWRLGNARYGRYQTPFVAGSALAWHAFGLRGIYLLPWVGAVLAVALAGGLGARAFASQKWGAVAALAFAVTTPILLYATLHFEHTLAVALVAGAVACMAHETPSWRRLIGAGILLGAGPAFRSELYCAPVAIVTFAFVFWGASLRTVARLALVGAAALVVVGGFWAWNLVTLGTWDPMLTVNLHVRQSKKWTESFELFFPVARRELWCWPPFVLALGAWFLRGRWRAAVVLAACAWLAVLATSGFSAGQPDSPRTLTGLFGATPLAILGLARGPLPRGSRLAAACVAAGTALVIAIFAADTRINGAGLELGSRYLLPATPLLVVGAIDLVRSQPRHFAIPFVALAALSFALTVKNAQIEAKLRGDNAAVIAAVERSGIRDVVTNFWWAPQVLSPLFSTKRVYLYPDDRLMTSLLEHGVQEVVRVHGGIVPHDGPRVIVEQRAILLPPQQVVTYGLSRPTLALPDP